MSFKCKNNLIVLLLPFFALGYNFPDTALDPSANRGADIFYPDSPSDRLYKLPFDAGLVCAIEAGPYNRDGVQHGHYQWDFPRPWGFEVIAARSGTVTEVSSNRVLVRSIDILPTGIITTVAEYLHVNGDGPLVQMGQEVAQGQLLCTVGQVGMWNHCHFEVRQTGHAGQTNLPGSTIPIITSTIPVPFIEVGEMPDGVPYHADGVPWGANIYISQNVRYTATIKPVVSLNKDKLKMTAYPNPFSGEVSLEMRNSEFAPRLGSGQGVRNCGMAIYNCNGILVHSAFPALSAVEGRIPHSNIWDWNGKDLAGNLVPPGIYIVRLTGDNRVLATQKIIAIR